MAPAQGWKKSTETPSQNERFEPKVTFSATNNRHSNVSSAKNMIPKTGSVADYKQCDINMDFASAGTQKKGLEDELVLFLTI